MGNLGLISAPNHQTFIFLNFRTFYLPKRFCAAGLKVDQLADLKIEFCGRARIKLKGQVFLTSGYLTYL